MKNTFIEENYLQPFASINQVVLKHPQDVFKKMGIYKKTAFDIFSTKLIVDEIKLHQTELGLDDIKEDYRLPIELEYLLESKSVRKQEIAKRIARMFGERLGYIFLTLKEGNIENKMARKQWNQEHWDFLGED